MNKNSLSKIILALLVGFCFLEAKTYKIGWFMFLNSSNSEVLNALDEIERYLNGEENYINIKAFKKNSQITKKITNICNILNKKNDEELQIFGEIMLVSEKLASGILDDNINFTSSSNFKLNYIAKTINSSSKKCW